MMDPLARLRSFPTAPYPNDNPSAIRGNVSLEDKQLNANILAHHIAHSPGSTVFANDVIKGLKLVEIYVDKRKEGAGGEAQGVEGLEAKTVCEIKVEENMLNVHGTLSGGCMFYLIDICTFASLFALGIAVGLDASGVSTSANLTWHGPATLGTELNIVSTSLTIGGRMAASRAEVYDKNKGRLLAAAVHTITPVKLALTPSKSAKARL